MSTVKTRKKTRRVMTREEIVADLKTVQRQREWHLKSKNMIQNRLVATVAGTIGYSSGLSDKERMKKFAEAKKVIEQIEAGKVASDVHGIVLTTMISVRGFNEAKMIAEDDMLALVKQLEITAWIAEEEQKGFGLLSLGKILGETGDLANYANPGKVWRRLGCAPFTKEGVTLMGATWRSRSKRKDVVTLHKKDWEEFGYSPRRRSLAYLIGEGLVKRNKSIYRERYDTAKAFTLKNRPDWTRCEKCKGTGRIGKSKCENCKGTGEVKMRCHNHAMLLATKLLLKNLWIEWNDEDRNYVYANE